MINASLMSHRSASSLLIVDRSAQKGAGRVEEDAPWSP
jgi:hypothetical protein